ncbi:MAG TPA: GNAT family N-acetyltransferase [Chryseolinea sp.]|nr:GNAT family N-acetyltransferase [Chryseolinea sp.]
MLLNISSLKIDPFDFQDLKEVPRLQPEGWADIFPSIEYYCKSDFCFPLKASLDGKLVGIGTAIIHGHSAWLAHIIVNSDHRNAGIGTAITKSLIDVCHKNSCRTLLLIATALGEPVYKKFGFEVDTKYLFFDHGSLPPDQSHQIFAFQKEFEDALFQLDRSISGEDRKKLLLEHLASTYLFIEDKQVTGFYIPTLGEGTIIAESSTAGLALMKLRAASTNKFCIPVLNESAVNILSQHGFSEIRRASRMILGERLSWDGSKIYSRIGGNLG